MGNGDFIIMNNHSHEITNHHGDGWKIVHKQITDFATMTTVQSPRERQRPSASGDRHSRSPPISATLLLLLVLHIHNTSHNSEYINHQSKTKYIKGNIYNLPNLGFVDQWPVAGVNIFKPISTCVSHRNQHHHQKYHGELLENLDLALERVWLPGSTLENVQKLLQEERRAESWRSNSEERLLQRHTWPPCRTAGEKSCKSNSEKREKTLDPTYLSATIVC